MTLETENYVYQAGDDGDYYASEQEAKDDALSQGWSSLQAAIYGGWIIAHDATTFENV